MSKIVEFFLRKSIFGNVFTALLIGWGIFIAYTIQKEAFPNINFDIVLINTLFPGASPDEVEKLVTIPIEDQLKSVDGIKEIRSSSIENISGITIFLDPDAKDTKKVINDIRSAVDRVTDLPADVEKPQILEITSGLQPIIEVHLSMDDEKFDYKSLRQYAENLENELKALDSVARVDKRNWLKREFIVKLDPKKLYTNYVGIEQILMGLKQRNVNFPGGEIIVNQLSKLIRTLGEFVEPVDIENFFIRSNEIGQGIRIRDVGYVVDDFEQNNFSFRTNGRKSIQLVVLKKENKDIIKTVESVLEVVNRFKKDLPPEIRIDYMNDFSYYVKRRLSILINNGLTGLFLVIISLLVFLNWRTALMVAFGIPISIGGALIIISLMGVTLNLISMVGMIIVVGILVDDAIVVSENFYKYLEQGYSTYEAAVRGTTEVIIPVFGSVLTTIVTFAPLLFLTGIIGKFIYVLPLVVIISLLTSLFEAFFILPSHLYGINKYYEHKKQEEDKFFYKFRKQYFEKALSYVISHKVKSFAFLIIFMLIVFALFFLFGKFKLFTGAAEAFVIRMKADPSIPLEKMDEYTVYISKVLDTYPKEDIENYRSSAGISQINATDPSTKRGSNYGMFIVYLVNPENRKRSGEDIVNDFREDIIWLLKGNKFKDNPINPIKKELYEKFKYLEGTLDSLTVELLRGGPPTGKPVSIEITGKDYQILKQIAEEFKAKVKEIRGVKNLEDDREPGKEEVRILINERLAAITGVSVESIAIAINAAYRGIVPTSIKKGTEEVDIRVRFDDKYHKDLNTIKEIYVLNRLGQLIPISRMVGYEISRGFVANNHLDGDRMVVVTADIDEKLTTSSSVNNQIQNFMKSIIEKCPGYAVRLGGENKDTEESMASLQKAFIAGFFVNFLILSSLFESILIPFVVLFTIPFALIGVFIAFLVHGEPISFLALVGFVGLSGVVVNNAIVLIDFAKVIRKKNPQLTIEQVAIQASSERLRAVILTSITTIFGLLPTAYGIGGSDPFLVPLALSMAWGLLFAAVLTLFLIPVLYALTEKFVEKVKKFLKLVEH